MTTEPVSARAHYDALLGEHYAWMLGPAEARIAAGRALFEELGIGPARAPRTALDLGAGAGHDAIALAELGHAVVAVDGNATLLAQLERARGGLPIAPALADLRDFRAIPGVAAVVGAGGFDVVACLGDTLTHLDDAGEVDRLLEDAAGALARGGVLVLTFRDLTAGAEGEARRIVVRRDADREMECLLRVEGAHVVVEDTIRVREGDAWRAHASRYRKLRVAPRAVAARLHALGLAVSAREGSGGMWTVVAR